MSKRKGSKKPGRVKGRDRGTGESQRPQPPLSPERRRLSQELAARLNSMLSSGIPTAEIAQILGAEDFLRPLTHGRVGVVFDNDGFVQAELQRVKPLKLPARTTRIDDVILPPGLGEVLPGEGKGMEPKEVIPRTEYLMEVLTQLNLEYELIDGTNTGNMMRKLSYKAFIIPEIGKCVLVCNEEGNATYILHQQPVETTWEDAYLNFTKDELKNRIPGDQVSYIEWTEVESWQIRITKLLLEGA
ncbi:hypothetical protein ACFL2M_02470, partial [Patescibacteria group bacterium]